VVAALFPFVAGVPHRSALGFTAAPAGTFVWGAVGILGLGPLADRIVITLKPYFPEQSSLEMIEAAVAGQPLWVLVPFLAVMPALGEELLCRGVLQRSIPWPAVALPVSAVFFAALHMDPLHMAGVLPLGFYLAWLGHRTGSVWVPVFAHFMNNLAAHAGHALHRERRPGRRRRAAALGRAGGRAVHALGGHVCCTRACAPLTRRHLHDVRSATARPAPRGRGPALPVRHRLRGLLAHQPHRPAAGVSPRGQRHHGRVPARRALSRRPGGPCTAASSR
jgi:membrane protease YdiL (CAAX protease family)